MNRQVETNPYLIHPANEVEIVRIFGRPEAAKHYALPTGEPHQYRLLCSGDVIDALAFGGALEYPTCKRCQRMDDAASLEVVCWKVGVALGYSGHRGGWIYLTHPLDRERVIGRPVCQGWGVFGNRMQRSWEAKGLIVRNVNGAGWYVNTLAVEAAAEARRAA